MFEADNNDVKLDAEKVNYFVTAQYDYKLYQLILWFCWYIVLLMIEVAFHLDG